MKTFILLSLVALCMPSAANAGTGTVSLKEAVQMALAQNHLLKAATFERSAAGHELSATRSRYFPRIRLDETLTASNSPTRVFMMKLDEGRFSENDLAIDRLNSPDSHSDFLTSIILEQPLFDPGIVRAVEMARKEDAARGFGLDRRREDTAFQVYDAYLQVQKAQSAVAVTEHSVTAAWEHERLTRVRGEAGTGLKSDELRARTHLSEMEQQRISARVALARARLRFARITGVKAGESLDIGEELRPFANVPGSDDLAHLALENRQDLKELASVVEKADAGVAAAKAEYLPKLQATAAYQMNDHELPFGRDNDAWLVGVNLRWEIFDGMRRGNEVGKARALRNAAAEYAGDYRAEVLLQVSEQTLQREDAAARLEVARNAVRDAEEGVRLIGRRFENSLATMVELLDAQTALNRARNMIVDAESDVSLATARLYHAAGIFLKEVMK